MTEIDESFEAILVCAVRYALGRRTYMPHLVMGYITPMLPELSKRTLSIMEKDVMFEGDLGDEQIDKPSWMQFLKDVQAEIKRR